MKTALIAGLFAAGMGFPAQEVVAARDSFDRDIRPVLSEYCDKCHGPIKPKAGLNLTAFTNTVSVYRELKLWQAVAAKLRDRDMPPENKPQPTEPQRHQLVQWIENSIKDLEEGRTPADPGRVLIHRLSRTEYNCTIRDLLGVDTQPADNFPSDGGGGGGFDNNADTLFIPPILMERYLASGAAVLDQANHDLVFFVKPGLLTSDRSRARQILGHFARLGFRRPLEEGELDRLMAVYEQARRQGLGFEPAVKLALTGILASPNFLFRVEQDQEGDRPYRISDYELASRLSYFLWSSMPDEELFRLADQNRLHEPKVLEEQVHRLIRDPKSKQFSDNFAGQWLRVRELKNSAQPDRNRFPEYTSQLRDEMYEEVIDFFDSLVREDASLLRILQSDYSVLNGQLARFYGLTNVIGNDFRKVRLNDPNRGGVLSMAAVLTLTSYPQRTSPVLRGKWVLEQILGTPPPPPPAMVKTLPPNDAVVDGLSFRQQLEKHREETACASCHERMDPLGFGLENFDPIGRWRTRIADDPVDASGVLPGGEKFSGPAELKQILLKRKDEFAHNVTEKMLAYSLGRGLEYYDVPAVSKIVKALAANEYRMSILITEIVKSYPFQYRRNQPIPMASD